MSKQKRGGRINRINPLIHQIVSKALLRNSDPVLNKATVTHVSTSPDLKKSIIFVSTLEQNEGSVKSSLEKNRIKIQRILAGEMTTRNVPKIIFEIDNTLNNVSRINDLIQKVNSNE
ncbi:30S ribosome-binding factor RbfA [Candidatus Actinomarina]|nr:30S ribosome-binding factor RbfA [Candidatus Actinomarina sp.]